MVFLHIKSLPNLLFGVLCLPGDQSHPFAQPTINRLACCICWAGLLGRTVFPPWNEGPNFGSYTSNEYSGLTSFRMDWLDLLVVQGTLKSLLQLHSSKASVLLPSVFFIVQLSHPYMTTGKTTALTIQTFVGKLVSAFKYAV